VFAFSNLFTADCKGLQAFLFRDVHRNAHFRPMSVKKSYGSPASGYSRSIERKLSPFGRSHCKSPSSRKQPSPGSTFTSDYLRKRNDELEVTGKVLASKNHAIAKKLSAVESTLVEAKRVIKDLRRELSHQAHKTAGCTRVQTKGVSPGKSSPYAKKNVAAQTTPGVFTKANPPQEPNLTPRPKFSGRSSFRSPLDVSSPPETVEIPRADVSDPVINRALFANFSLPVDECGADSMHAAYEKKLSIGNQIVEGAQKDDDEDELELSLASTSVLSPLISEQKGSDTFGMKFGAQFPPPRIPAPEFGNAAFFAQFSTTSPRNKTAPSSEADSNKFDLSPPKIFADVDLAKDNIPTTAVVPVVQVPTRPVLTSLLDCPPIQGQQRVSSEDTPIKLLKSPKSAHSAEKVVFYLTCSYKSTVTSRLSTLLIV